MEIPAQIENRFYEMNPAEDAVMIEGHALLNGMIVLLEDANDRSYDGPSMSDSDKVVARRNNRWCRVTQMRTDSDEIRFVGVYSDGVECARSYRKITPWLYKVGNSSEWEHVEQEEFDSDAMVEYSQADIDAAQALFEGRRQNQKAVFEKLKLDEGHEDLSEERFIEFGSLPGLIAEAKGLSMIKIEDITKWQPIELPGAVHFEFDPGMKKYEFNGEPDHFPPLSIHEPDYGPSATGERSIGDN